MTRDVRAVIDLDALRQNYQTARKHAPNARCMAVVKANAYGHGLVEAATALARIDADGFAVSCLEEAIPLRDAGITQPILLLQGPFHADELAEIVARDLDIVLHDHWQLDLLASAKLAGPVTVWLKVDTGMGRLGFAPDEVADAYRRLQGMKDVADHIRLMTHLACADDRDDPMTQRQQACFQETTASLGGERSLANSAAVLGWPDTHADWVRPGIMLYGANPFVDRQAAPALQPVMTLMSRLVAIKTMPAGHCIGYGASFTCPEEMPVGVVTVGYGDGYPRHVPTGTPILVGGQRTRILGRVSMDLLCVDLRGLEVCVHDPVVLWGKGLPAEEIADAAGTIAYELFCQVTPRVPRIYEG